MTQNKAPSMTQQSLFLHNMLKNNEI